ncbi:putative membrane protein C14C4.07 [Hypsizygus marmoreus]|uniref:Membrane protein C14C4.07 n=1 Tax=Hypsizygus marmoreus TaxID=39966 RepID=A0A369JP96_HYPMA|nr:putative membrane protein C14C4.07 [Hypsizygus marmoreus]
MTHRDDDLTPHANVSQFQDRRRVNEFLPVFPHDHLMPSSRSRQRSRPRRSPSPGPYVPQAESLILPDGAVSEEAAELLADLVHPHREYKHIDADSDYRMLRESTKHLPWWRRPSSWWLLGLVPFTAIAMAATMAPRIEIYTLLACSVHKPDIFRHSLPSLNGTSGLPLPGISAVTPGSKFISLQFNTTMPFILPMSGLKNNTEPGKPTLCASDPVVQAAVAKLTAVMAASMGILSCVTTGWWGAFSDRHGRTRVMGLSIVGLLITDFNFIFVSHHFQHLPGGYWFLLVGPLIEGCLGGMTTAIAAMHAYLADTTTEGTRSRTFSLSLGLLFTGMAIGPTFGGLLIRATGKTLSVFYAAGLAHLIYALMVWFIIPESLLRQQMNQSQVKYDDELHDMARDREVNPAVGFLVRVKRLFAFLSPLTVFLPEIKERRPGDNPLKRKKRDWNLTLVAAGYGMAVTVMGSYTYKFQFASSTFGWTSETLGYWLSLIGATRAAFLTLLLPVIIKIFKPQPMTIELPLKPVSTEQDPLLSPSQSSTSPNHCATPNSPPQTIKKEIHSPSFDLGLARGSLFVEVIGYTFMAFAPTATAFTLSSMFGSMGAGFSPAVQSVALALYVRRGGTESGRLFGALSVVQALCSQIVGPALYGLVYMETVASTPRAIFFVSMITIALSFTLLTLVRLPKEGGRDGLSGIGLLSGGVQDEDEEGDEESRIGGQLGGGGVSATKGHIDASSAVVPSTSSSNT